MSRVQIPLPSPGSKCEKVANKLILEGNKVKYLWLTIKDNSCIKIYYQKKSVDYADYKPGMLYVSVHEVFDK